MKFNISKLNKTVESERTQKVMSDFDIKPEHANETFVGEIDFEDEDWNIGIIVGTSGTGKTTIAREVFGESYINGYTYNDASVLDNMPSECDVHEIELAFSSVGFSSPPSWLKPYKVLSTGERMRVDLARALLESEDVVVFDEFTSVVDREVAKTCSIAIQKQVRKTGKKFVAISCHRDIIEYLNPDWIYDTDQQSFFGQGRCMSLPGEKSTYTKLADLISKKYGEYLGSIII